MTALDLDEFDDDQEFGHVEDFEEDLEEDLEEEFDPLGLSDTGRLILGEDPLGGIALEDLSPAMDAEPPSPAPAPSGPETEPEPQAPHRESAAPPRPSAIPSSPKQKMAIPPDVRAPDEFFAFPDAEPPEFMEYAAAPPPERPEEVLATPPDDQVIGSDRPEAVSTGAPLALSPHAPSAQPERPLKEYDREIPDVLKPQAQASPEEMLEEYQLERAPTKAKKRMPSAIKAVKDKVWSQAATRRMIDHDLVRPGPLERAIERIRWLSWIFYKTIGFSTLMLLHIIDNLWEFVSSYISRVFKGLMNLRSASRVAARRAEGKLIEGLKRDMTMMMGATEQLLCLPSTQDYITPDHHQLSEDVLISVQRGTPLALALSARARLDDLRRDLNFIRKGGGRQRFWSALFKWLIGLIPNPFEVIKPWFNALLLSFKIYYSRAQVQENHLQLIDTLGRLIDELEAMKTSTEMDTRASTDLVNALQSQLDAFLTLCLQSKYQARPWSWRLIDQLSSLHTLSGHYVDHPLSALEARRALLSVCADVERIPMIGAQMRAQSTQSTESYQAELEENQRLIKHLRRLRERGLL
jgi:hypothetical protein